ncbi:MAG: type IV secretory system conjugative DNA transfer family protein [Candidatus Saccharimonadales bacterium]
MNIFLKALGVLLALILIIGPVVYYQVRKIFREQKNYERGLKIVPILIHLPPPSDDTEVGARDARDVNEETISKAQIIYNIIASTWQKGFKHKFYGQRHFAFEIVGTEGFIYFYAAVPVALLDVIKQAIISAYPTARLEEVAEHNIFNDVGKLNGTLGGELVLKDSYAYPIATYLDLKRDALQSILSSMANLNKEDGAAIQILLRPADTKWRKVASKVASSKRKGDKHHGSGPEAFLWWARSVAVALFKPPDQKEQENKSKELSNLEQATLDSIDDKTRHAAFEVVIRVLVSSNVSQRSQSILRQIVASFALFDQPGKNGFKYIPAKDIESLVTSYIMRFFPQHNVNTVLNSVELATLFHFPDQNNIPTSQLVKQASKQVDGPRNIPEDGLLLGFNVFRGVRKPIRLSLVDRQRHIYAVGQTGTGKSMFLENLALQDMLSGNGFAFVDPHGDTVENLLSMIPKERTEDLIYFSPGDMDYPMGLNLFEYHSADQKDFLIQEALNMLYKLYDPQHQGIMGPRYEHLFRMAALTVMADPAGGTFVDIPKLFRDPKYVDQKLQYVTDQNVIDFWKKEMPQSQRSNDFGEVVSWFVSKFGAFLSNDMMRNIIGQTKSAFDLREIMDKKKILLVNLSKGGTGELNSKLLGMIFVMKFQAAAMSRVDVPEAERQDFALYVDEFQNFSTDSLATIMSEARKFHLNLIVANQFTTQLSSEIRDAVFGNIGTIVSFRIGQNDVESVGKYFQPLFEAEDLLRIPNYNTVVRTLIGGVPTQPFTMATLPQLGTPNKRLGEALKQLSAAKYGRPKAVVEKEIFARMATKEEPKPALGGSANAFSNPNYPTTSPPLSSNPWARPIAQPQASPLNPAPQQPRAGGSFLDDWLAKRRAPVGQPMPPNPYSLSGTPRSQATVTTPITQGQTISQTLNGNPQIVSPQTVSPQQPEVPRQNISSNEIEQVEVDKIAGELKNQLNIEQDATKEPQPTSGHMKDGDTIYIDRSGVLNQLDKEKQDSKEDTVRV